MKKFKKVNVVPVGRLRLYIETLIKRKQVHKVFQNTTDPERSQELEKAMGQLDRTMRILVDQWTPQVDAVLEPLNGRATKHTLSGNDIAHTIVDVERQLERDGVPLKDRKGITVEIVGGVPTTKSYARKAHTAVTNRVVLQRTGTNWWMIECDRLDRWAGPGGEEKIQIYLTEDAKTAIIRKALSGYIAR